MDDEVIKEKVAIIRKAFANYPKNDTTVDEMIAQGLRIGWVRGIHETQEEAIKAIKNL